MIQEARDLSKRVLDAKRDFDVAESRLKTAEQALEDFRNQCSHDWTEPKYEPEVRAAYTSPPSGAGSDWRPEVHVPRKETPRWKRKCKRCGKEEITEKTQAIQKPDFGS